MSQVTKVTFVIRPLIAAVFERPYAQEENRGCAREEGSTELSTGNAEKRGCRPGNFSDDLVA